MTKELQTIMDLIRLASFCQGALECTALQIKDNVLQDRLLIVVNDIKEEISNILRALEDNHYFTLESKL